VQIFKKIDGEAIELIKYTLNIISTKPDVAIYVGTDSQNCKKVTKYVTVVAYRYGSRGVHFIYQLSSEKKIKDQFERLFKEAEMSIKIAEYLKSKSISVFAIDLDYNKNKKFESNKLVTATRGWCESLGYKVIIKPDEQVATRAADMIVNK
jgi:predicted RNase H-related nuclease YkuK (DUF458 family)